MLPTVMRVDVSSPAPLARFEIHAPKGDAGPHLRVDEERSDGDARGGPDGGDVLVGKRNMEASLGTQEIGQCHHGDSEEFAKQEMLRGLLLGFVQRARSRRLPKALAPRLLASHGPGHTLPQRGHNRHARRRPPLLAAVFVEVGSVLHPVEAREFGVYLSRRCAGPRSFRRRIRGAVAARDELTCAIVAGSPQWPELPRVDLPTQTTAPRNHDYERWKPDVRTTAVSRSEGVREAAMHTIEHWSFESPTRSGRSRTGWRPCRAAAALRQDGGRVRGVAVFGVREGKVAEKLSHVKDDP